MVFNIQNFNQNILKIENWFGIMGKYYKKYYKNSRMNSLKRYFSASSDWICTILGLFKSP